jgi:Spy/CpxP family protein refolding chaperone
MKRWMWSLVFAAGLTSLAAVALAQSRAPMPPRAPAPPATPAPPDMADDDDGLFAWDDDGGAGDADMDWMPPGDDGGGPGRPGFGGPWSGGRWGVGHRMMDRVRIRARLAEELNLTSDQRARIGEIRDRAEKRRIQAMADLRIAAVDLRHLVRSERPDRRAIDAQIDRLATMRASLMKAQIGTRLEMHSILTPEQERKLRDGMGRGRGDRDDRGNGGRDD